MILLENYVITNNIQFQPFYRISMNILNFIHYWNFYFSSLLNYGEQEPLFGVVLQLMELVVLYFSAVYAATFHLEVITFWAILENTQMNRLSNALCVRFDSNILILCAGIIWKNIFPCNNLKIDEEIIKKISGNREIPDSSFIIQFDPPDRISPYPVHYFKLKLPVIPISVPCKIMATRNHCLDWQSSSWRLS
jgi:hypothetical protein